MEASQTKRLKTTLSTLGFSEPETRVFLAAARLGKATGAEIAKAAGQNRTTTYSILKQLVQKGVVSEDLGAAVTEFFPAPEGLNALVEKEEAVVKEKKKAAEAAAEAMQAMVKEAKYEVPKIQFVPEERLSKFLYQRLDEWNKSVLERDKIVWGFQETAFVERFHEWIDWWAGRVPKDIDVRLITNDSEAERMVAEKGYEQRKTAFWKDGVNFTATSWVMGDYVVMFVLSEQPNYLVEIRDRALAQNLRALYKGLWEDIGAKRSPDL
jgi:sugar-specific transcriptional regulator TrmB